MKKVLALFAATMVAGTFSTANAQLITDFEAFAAGNQVIFQAASFSGSTSANIAAAPAPTAAVSDTEPANSGTKSLRVEFGWVDSTSPTAWCRFTNFNAPNLPNLQLDPDLAVTFFAKVTTGAIEFRAWGGRENATNAGPVGATGGVTSGPIEYIGADGIAARILDSAVSTAWTKITVQPTEPAFGLTGDGVIDPAIAFFTFDSLRLEPVSGNAAVVFFLDDFAQEAASEVTDWSVY